jgi:hypothetical protein
MLARYRNLLPALLILGAGIVCFWNRDSIQQLGATIMTQYRSDALEQFNQPERFLADAQNLNLLKIVWHSNIEAAYTRLDGARVSIIIWDGESGKTHYIEDITHPKSPFKYRNAYNEKGDLVHKSIEFYGIALYDDYDCKAGKCVPSTSSEPGMKPIIPMEHTRAVLLKEAGFDLYDTSKIKRATLSSQDNKHYCYVRTFASVETLYDAETAKVLYRRNIFDGYESTSSIPGDWEEERSPAYIKSEKMVKNLMNEGDSVYAVFNKTDTRDRDRFYEIFIAKSTKYNTIPLVSFLLDHKKNRIIYQFETKMYFMSPEGMPYTEFWNEYEQHLKMLEAEEEQE